MNKSAPGTALLDLKPMLSHEEMVLKMLKDPEVKAEYDALEPEFELLDELLQARNEAGLTQEDVAKRMGTSQTCGSSYRGRRRQQAALTIHSHTSQIRRGSWMQATD